MCYLSGVIDSLKQILSTCSGPLLMHVANLNPSSKTRVRVFLRANPTDALTQLLTRQRRRDFPGGSSG